MIKVLTLSYNGLNYLKKLKNGLFKNLKNVSQDYEWLIRSNGCKDGTVAQARKWENTRVFSIEHNRDSFSKGVNYLFEKSKSNHDDLILLLNNDIIFRDDKSLKNMIDLMDKTKASICGARLMYPNTNKISHVGVAFSPYHNSMPWHYRMNAELENRDKKNRYFQAVTAACCFVRSNDFKMAGGLDENLFWAFEDICLNLHISKLQNKKIVCCGATEIDHETSATLQRNNYNKLFLQKNVAYFKFQWNNKYELDYDLYMNNPNYNIIK